MIDYQAGLQRVRARNKQLREAREMSFYKDFLAKMVNKADRNTGRLAYTNGVLSYNPGVQSPVDPDLITGAPQPLQKGVEYSDLWNEFKALANKKDITIDKATFDAIWGEYNNMSNQAWMNSFNQAVADGASQDDFYNLYKADDMYRNAFTSIHNAKAQLGEAGLAEYSMLDSARPSGEFMRDEGFFAGVGKAIKEHPGWWGAGALGTAILGKKFGPGIMESFRGGGGGGIKGFIKGGLPFAGAMGLPYVAKALGASEETADILGTTAMTGVGGHAAYKGVTNLIKNRTAGGLVVDKTKTQLLKTAKDLNFKNISKKSTANTLKKKVVDKVLKSPLSHTKNALSKKTITSAITKWGTRTAVKQVAGSALPVYGNIAMGLYSAYDLARIAGDYFLGKGEFDETPSYTQEEYNDLISQGYTHSQLTGPKGGYTIKK